MEVARINGGQPLHGIVHVSGSKNSSLAILAATLLTAEPCIIDNVPDVSDIRIVLEILQAIGATVEYLGPNTLKICAKNISNNVPEELYSKTRGAISIAGALLARLGEAEIFLPGGCSIGARPIDLHILGFKKLGFDVAQQTNKIVISGKNASATDIFLGSKFGSTVTGTVNIILAACGLAGETVIESAACEPEIVDLCEFLTKIGAEIHGIGSPTLKIVGKKQLHGCEHKVLSDRIEAGTFICAGLITRGNIEIRGLERHILGSLINLLTTAGANIIENDIGIFVDGESNLSAIEAVTMPYPGFPTDVQAQVVALLTQAGGESLITETIFPNRFAHVKELQKMGAKIDMRGSTAAIYGRTQLIGSEVSASDLRASASLYLAGLAATGTTIVRELQHLDRGYDQFEAKLQKIGAKIERVKVKA